MSETRTHLDLPEDLAQLLGRALLGLSGTPIQVLLTDAERRLIWANPSFCETSGYDLEEILGKNPGHFLQGKETDPKTVEAIRAACADGTFFNGEVLNYDKSGRAYWISLNIFPIRNAGGRITHYIGLQREITGHVAARKNLEVLSQCMDRSNDVVIITEAEPLAPPGPRIVYVNKTFERETGYTAAEALGQTPRILHSPNSAESELDRLRAALAAWQPETVELINRRKDGSEFWSELSVAPVAGDDGKYTHWVSVQRDISERKNMEARLVAAITDLRRTNALLAAAERIGAIGNWQVFFDGRPPLWSDATYAIHDLEPGTPVTLDMAIKFYAPEHQDMVRRVVEECVAGGKPFELEAIIVTTKGRNVWTRSRGEPNFDSEGNFTSMHGVIQNIDREKRAMLALEERDRRLTALSRNLPGLLFQFHRSRDGQMSLPFISESTEALLGILPDHYEQPPLWVFLSRVRLADVRLLEKHFIKTAAQPAPIRLNIQYNHPSSGLRWLRLASTPIRDEDGGTTWHGYLEDVTDLKAIEEQLRETARKAEAANVAKSVFLSNMSHEIRTPLNAVVGMAELLKSKAIDQETRSYIGTIRASANALLNLIDDILDFSKIEAGQVVLCPGPTDVRAVVESALIMVADSARRKGLELVSFVDPEMPRMIICDQGRLRQILLNLLSNAVKFTQSGYVRVNVSPATGPGGEQRVRVSVSDTGIGIPAEAQDRLFERFSQVQSASTREFGGTGLGLAIVRRLLELMGGSIEMRSEVDVGTEFTLELPLIEHMTSSTALMAPPRQEWQGVEALLIHCQPGLREVYTRVLSATGLNVRVISSIADYISDPPRGYVPGLVVLDWIRPDFQPMETLRQLRELSGHSDVRALILHHAGRAQAPEHLDSNVAQVTKPVQTDDLHRALRALFAKSQADRETGPEESVADFIKKVNLPAKVEMSMLLVEDNAVNRRVMALLLEKIGVECDLAVHGREAVEAVKARTYDVVLMDVQMPVMDGLEATREIRRLPILPQPYIVAVTANATPADRDACFAAGMDDYLSKPVRRDDVVRVLKSACLSQGGAR